MASLKKLGELSKGVRGVIIQILRTTESASYADRLLEMGLLPGRSVEILHEAPFGGDPIAVCVRGTFIALRRIEANAIEVEVHE